MSGEDGSRDGVEASLPGCLRITRTTATSAALTGCATPDFPPQLVGPQTRGLSPRPSVPPFILGEALLRWVKDLVQLLVKVTHVEVVVLVLLQARYRLEQADLALTEPVISCANGRHRTAG